MAAPPQAVTPRRQDGAADVASLVALGKATLTKKHKAGDFVGALAEFKKWNRAGGRVMAGLTRRRAAEAELYGRGS